jgi:hypothetical protein
MTIEYVKGSDLKPGDVIWLNSRTVHVTQVVNTVPGKYGRYRVCGMLLYPLSGDRVDVSDERSTLLSWCRQTDALTDAERV